MTIQQLNVYDHKVQYGSEEGQHQRTKDFIATTLKSVLTTEQIDRLDVYNLDGTSHTFNAGHESREIIFINGGASSPSGAIASVVIATRGVRPGMIFVVVVGLIRSFRFIMNPPSLV